MALKTINKLSVIASKYEGEYRRIETEDSKLVGSNIEMMNNCGDLYILLVYCFEKQDQSDSMGYAAFMETPISMALKRLKKLGGDTARDVIVDLNNRYSKKEEKLGVRFRKLLKEMKSNTE
jgi:hypothetical protein